MVQKAKTFLDDLDLELDTDLQEPSKSKTAQPNNNNTSSKTPRASGRLRSRVNTDLTSAMATSKSASAVPSSGDPLSTYSIITTNNNMVSPVKSSPVTNSAAASQSSSVPISIIDDCVEIQDKNTKKFNEIPTMKLKAVTYAKIKIKNKKKFAKKKC